jgi:putative ABC transport system substrate-binding protein
VALEQSPPFFVCVAQVSHLTLIQPHCLPERYGASRRLDTVPSRRIGTAVAWPLAASAQQHPKVYRIAIVSPRPVEWMNEGASGKPGFKALFGELRRLGYVEGQNLIVERYSEGNIAHWTELAREVVRHQPDLIFSTTTRLILRLKEATSTIPIVAYMSDPIAWGVVDSLARPTGNITGV